MIAETPVSVVDLDRLERNLDRMAEYAALHRLTLRPHTKTEAMPEVSDNLLLAYPPVGEALRASVTV